MFFHTSNRYMDVTSIVIKVAESLGLETRYIDINDFSQFEHASSYRNSVGVLVGHAGHFEKIKLDNNDVWQHFEPSPNVQIWTDDYSSVIGAIKSRIRGEGKVVASRITPTSGR